MFLEKLIRFFTSLKLTVVCLGLGLILVFWGTIAQVDLGLYKAQNEFFRSVFIYWHPKGASWKIPIFPGGYFLGVLLLLNLVAAHLRRFTFTRNKVGLFLIHAGLILLLVGQLLTDMLSKESTLHLREGQVKNYTEAEASAELAIIDTTDADSDKVIAVPASILRRQGEIQNDALPFKLRVRNWYPNSAVSERKSDQDGQPAATQGFGPRLIVEARPTVTAMDQRDIPSAIVEFIGDSGSLGTWAVSAFVEQPQRMEYKGRTYELSLRRERLYKPYNLQLVDFRHDLYPGTDIPKNFSSRVRVRHPGTGEDREVLIYMNNPLRYAGETYYQASFDTDNQGTILQVVRNPSWLAPYASTIMVSAGLLIQFIAHMLKFVKKRRAAV
jgi:hypothetical protein